MRGVSDQACGSFEGFRNIPELIVIVDDGVDLLATRHGRGEDGVNGESDLGISTPAPNENPGCRKKIETKTRLRCQKKSKNRESREEITREEKET